MPRQGKPVDEALVHVVHVSLGPIYVMVVPQACRKYIGV